MGHQGQASLEGVVGILQLQVAVAIGEGGKNLPEMAIHGGEGLHEGLLAQGGDGFDPQQQLFPFAVEHLQPFVEFGQPLLEGLQFLQRQHVHRLQRLHALLNRLQVGLQGFQHCKS